MILKTEEKMARVLGITQSAVNGLSKQIPLESSGDRRKGYTPIDQILMLSVGELMEEGLSGPQAASIISEAKKCELVHLFTHDNNRVWLLVSKDRDGIVGVRSVTDWADAEKALGGSSMMVIPLHAIVFRALKRVMVLQEAHGHG